MIESSIEPDTKDWTWVLDQPCPECGFVAADVDRTELGGLVRDNAVGWATVLRQPGATERPDERTWSPLEYACHVRDVHRVFVERLALMLEQDEPTFANWDQDETALTDRYDRQDPAVVAPELVAAAEAMAVRYDELRERARGDLGPARAALQRQRVHRRHAGPLPAPRPAPPRP